MSEGRITLYHTTLTDRVCSILREGFRETTYIGRPGVHLCDKPDRHFRAAGKTPETVLAISLPVAEVTGRLQDIQMPDCSDYIVPAAVVHSSGVVWVERSV